MSHRIAMIVSGALLIAGGVLALFLPYAATLTATLIVGWAFFAAGIVHIYYAFRSSEDRWWNAGFGILAVLLGLSFVFDPLGGMISLTILLGVLFLASGVMQFYLAWNRRRRDSVWMLWLSGVLSVALAVVIAFNLYAAATVVPGILLGIELISTGVAFLLLRPIGDSGRTMEGPGHHSEG